MADRTKIPTALDVRAVVRPSRTVSAIEIARMRLASVSCDSYNAAMQAKRPAQTGTVGSMVTRLREHRRHLVEEIELIDVALDALQKAWSIDAGLAKNVSD